MSKDPVGTMNAEAQGKWQEWIDGIGAAAGPLMDTSQTLALAAPGYITDETNKATVEAMGDAVQAARETLSNYMLTMPEAPAFTAWADSHPRRRTKKVRSRQ